MVNPNEIQDETEIDVTEIIERIEKIEAEIKGFKSTIEELAGDIVAIADAIDEESNE